MPIGASLEFASAEFEEHERLGLDELDGCAFVLVATSNPGAADLQGVPRTMGSEAPPMGVASTVHVPAASVNSLPQYLKIISDAKLL